MQLVKLELKGFKSFGDKVIINFDEGITGIVGPNGCGKSNIVDAIRWVLGEQKTRALRSDKMENVIFNGTKNRKPTQLAEVSLTFNNTKNLLPTEYSQLTITRRYYRSGESEYMLNGIACRLKDITNLFLDTGIASNSYAIIELKMVDDLLNDKDNSRRGLFEEAAGISKFKQRKKETMRKLDGTDEDLERVEDLLYEIEKNLKSLEKQARQAERYLKIKDEYKTLSVDLARSTVSNQKQIFDSINKQIEAESDRKLSVSKQVKEKDAEIEKLKSEMLTREKLLSTRQKALNEFVNKIRQYESDKKVKNERLRFLNDKSDSLRDQIDQDKKSNERARFSIDSLVAEKNSAEKMFLEIQAKLDKSKTEKEEQEVHTTQIRQEAEAIRDLHKSKQEEAYQYSKSLEINQIQLSALKQQLEKAASNTSEQSASLHEFEKKTTALKIELDKKTEVLDKLKHSEEELNKRVKSTDNTIGVIRDELTQVGRKLDARQNEFNLTKSLVDNLEGYPEAIKFLKKESSWGKQAPLLSDILTCDQDYRVTIENYLEPFLNYYIVDSEADAYKAVNLLSEATKGKANFFILNSFKKYSPASPKLYERAFPASEIMEYEEKYKDLISHILDNVYIVDGDETSMPDGTDSIFITKAGKVTKRKFSISGGSVGLFEGKKIGRAKNLEKLEKEIKLLSKQLAKIEQSLTSKTDELDKLKNSTNVEPIEKLQIEINHINEEYISISSKQEQFGELLSNADTTKEEILIRIEEINLLITEHGPHAEAAKKDLIQLEGQLAIIQTDLEAHNELLRQRNAAFNEENIFFHQQENRISSLDREIEYKRAAHTSSKERIEKNLAELKSNQAEIKQMLEKTESNDDELLSMYEEKESIEGGVNEAEKKYYANRGTIDEVEKSQRELQHVREEIDSLLLELNNKLNETKLELGSIKERLAVEFEIDLDDLLSEVVVQEPTDPEELRANVEKIKHRIDTMGPVNPMAMEAYEEIKERHTFITEQKDDLLKSKESLLATISEIDLVAKATFLEAFGKIKGNFINVFRSLFTEEDDCDLTLSNPDDPLESSIDIIAKPKGKRPLTINQLSGGEKTLTATSLLFAIYLLKPAPFCIFDEVDAPLDDANIDKFNNIIQKFSKDSQFIIVTHNKRTMARTDVIYGITMIEQGVSRVVPVDLRELA